MFINEYDILLDKILDNIYDKEDISKISKINLEKQLRNSNKYIKDTEKLSKDANIIKQINIITQNNYDRAKKREQRDCDVRFLIILQIPGQISENGFFL